MATDRINVHVVDTTIDIGLTVMDCPNCGVVFGVPKWFDSRRREDGKGFYCPNGHVATYGKSALDKEREARQQAEQSQRSWREWGETQERQKKAAEASLRATKGALTKVKRRAEAGVCLHCHRTFQNVARHMKSQHPVEQSDG